MAAMCVGADAPLSSTIVEAGPPPVPAEGQVCVHVAKLVVTANTLTYAVAGKNPMLKYFQNFPVPDDIIRARSRSTARGQLHGVQH